LVRSKDLQSDNKTVEFVELDEMHSFIGLKKNYCWIWIAVDRLGKEIHQFLYWRQEQRVCIQILEQNKKY